jgi:hypothetical protein
MAKRPPDAATLDDLARLAKLRAEVDGLILKSVKKARRQGWSWDSMAPSLGVSRQAVYQKYKSKVGT